MSHTVEQAKELWCPMARHHDTIEPADCIASQCAMWRWQPEPPDLSTYPDPPRNPHKPQQPTHGYCGLAGKP